VKVVTVNYFSKPASLHHQVKVLEIVTRFRERGLVKDEIGAFAVTIVVVELLWMIAPLDVVLIVVALGGRKDYWSALEVVVLQNSILRIQSHWDTVERSQ
jgi:hypothetical protein